MKKKAPDLENWTEETESDRSLESNKLAERGEKVFLFSFPSSSLSVLSRTLEERGETCVARCDGFVRPRGTPLGAETKISGQKSLEEIVWPRRRLILMAADKIRIICSNKARLLDLIKRSIARRG